MYTSYFGFREEPFSITPDPRFFYANPGHEEAYASLLYGIRQRKGYIALIGEAGTGKTTLLRRVVRDLEKTVRVAFYYYNTTLTFDEFLDFICTSFGLQIKEGRKLEKIQAIDRFLRARLAEGGTGVLIIDEAHHLTDDVLENLRLLSNIEFDNQKLLQIVLVGQPELEQKLDRPGLRQLKQRIAVSCRLGCLKPQAVEPFIHYRMQTAGCNRYDVFTPRAIQLIATHSDGIPRVINTICDNSLSAAYQASQQTVSEQVVEKVTADLRLKGKVSLQGSTPSQDQPKKVNVIRVNEEIWGRAALPSSPNGLPEIWVGERPWDWTKQLHWVGIGTVAALCLLYVGNGSFSTEDSAKPQAGHVSMLEARSPVTPQPVSPSAHPTLPSPVQTGANEPAQTMGVDTSIAAPPGTSLSALEANASTRQKTTEQETPVIASLALESITPTSSREIPSTAPVVRSNTTSDQPSPSPLPQAVSAPTGPTPGNEQPPAQSTDGQNASPEQSIIVARGDTISELVLKIYGNYSPLALDLIKEFNPSLTDLNRILIGQRLILPSLSRETLLRKEQDGAYRLILGTFLNQAGAERAAEAARSKGYSATVTKRWVTSARSLYRVELEKLPDIAAVDRAWELVRGNKS